MPATAMTGPAPRHCVRSGLGRCRFGRLRSALLSLLNPPGDIALPALADVVLMLGAVSGRGYPRNTPAGYAELA